MVRAHVVERRDFEKDEEGNPKSDYWGEYDFVILPRVSETVELWHGSSLEQVSVKSILHRAVEAPIMHPDLSSWQKEPSVLVIVSRF